MDSQIKKLKEKYWAGETSIAEEKELKAYYRDNPSLDQEGMFYRELSKQKETKPERSFNHPGKRKLPGWWSAAAAILILISVGIFVIQNDQKKEQYAVEDPMEAFEITRASLMKVSEGLNKGKTYSQELDRINKAKESITY